MDIIFEVNSYGKKSQEVRIINQANGQVIGRIFTPSGTCKDRMGAIQVCGFDDCFDLWGCGVFGDGEGNPKKDIQLLFNENSKLDKKIINDTMTSMKCNKCFNYYRGKDGNRDEKGKCKCEDLRIKEVKEIVLDKLGGGRII